MRNCPCGSGKSYSDCCELLISGKTKAATAEQLMRSRFTAYSDKNVDYIMATTHPEKAGELNRAELQAWADSTTWEELKILDTNGADLVEFVASYRDKDAKMKHHELAQFKQSEGDWFFYDSQFPKQSTVKNESPKVGRNDPCICGSGKKYKKCCGSKA